MGSTASSGIQQVTCTGYAVSSGTGTFSGCSGGTGTVAAGNDVGGPGAAIASYATLSAIGEGKNKAAPLYDNNEDYTALRAAYTTNGTTFTDLGIISGTDPVNQTDINNPASQAVPSTSDHDLALGAQDNPELRYVGTRGTIILNSDGTLGMFDSGSWQSDGDSDAFNQIFYTTSTDGIHGRRRSSSSPPTTPSRPGGCWSRESADDHAGLLRRPGVRSERRAGSQYRGAHHDLCGVLRT